MSTPLISIILPTHNRSASLARAIKSICNQTFSDFELIIVDDGSTDKTQSIVKQYASIDNRIISIYHREHCGAASARNLGIRTAKGKFLAFQDSDDEWINEKLEQQYKTINDLTPDYGFIFSTYTKIHKNRSFIVPRQLLKINSDDLFIDILAKNLVGMPTVLMRKSCIEKVGLINESLPALEDWEFFIRMSKHFKTKYTKKPMVNVYTDQPYRISTDVERLLAARINIFINYRQILYKHPFIYIRHMIKITLFFFVSLCVRLIQLSRNKSR